MKIWNAQLGMMVEVKDSPRPVKTKVDATESLETEIKHVNTNPNRTRKSKSTK